MVATIETSEKYDFVQDMGQEGLTVSKDVIIKIEAFVTSKVNSQDFAEGEDGGGKLKPVLCVVVVGDDVGRVIGCDCTI